MNIIRIQGEAELRTRIYYEYDADSTPLGEGGMGRVFKGYRINTKTNERMPVAIKAIYENIPERVVERARREADIQLDHDNLIRMYGFVQTSTLSADGSSAKVHYHVVMELLVGITLEDLLKGITTDKHGTQIPLAAELYSQYCNQREKASIRIMKAVLAGLMSLHDRSIIHRDIDPSNIMITLDNKIKLIDFGICKQIVTLGSQDKGLTSSGVFIGKVNFAAPELVLGDVKNQNYTTDIYAMGVLLYQMITGHLPFSGTDQEVLAGHLRKTFPMDDIKRGDVKKIIKKATNKEQSKRYTSAAEMRVALEQIKPSPGPIKIPSKIFAMAAGVVAVAVVATILIFNGKTDEDDTSLALQDSISVQVVAKPSSKDLLANAINFMDADSSGFKEKGSNILMSLANDSAYAPAMLEYGMLYAHATRAFSELGERQAKLGVKPNLQVSNEWLQKVLDKDPSNYKAAYWIYNNLMTKFDDSVLSADEREQLVSAFTLFKKIVETTDDEEALRYKNAMIAADDENTLRIWALIN